MVISVKKQVYLAFTYFIIAAFFGVVLRLFHAIDLPINYKFIVHTHSHIALLGWVYLILTTLLYHVYLSNQSISKKHRNLFLFTQITLIGMLVTFPFQGYALFSIIFSTLFLIASYLFTWFFITHVSVSTKASYSYKIIKSALVYLVISSIGPWALGAIMTMLGPLSIWYRLAIYFYLHFLYNGWMILALVGLFFYILENKKITINKKTFTSFYRLINAGVILSFFLSILWIEPSLLYNGLGGLGALIQLIAIVFLICELRSNDQSILNIFTDFQKMILKTVFGLFVLKMLLQLITALPYFAMLAVNYLDFTIGYLHLTFLGIISLSIFFFLDYFQILKVTKGPYLLYITSFAITELLIFYKGFASWQKISIIENYYSALAFFSALILISIVLILVLRKKA